MAKKNSTSSAVVEVDEQKKRKKQAKKEAKLMLEIEQAKVSIQKAEKKLAKAQVRLEARNTDLHTIEAELTEFRTSHEETELQPQSGNSDHEAAQHASVDEDATIVADAG